MILVVGSTGMVGSEVCRLLRTSGEPVRALVRPASAAGRVAQLREEGCEVVEGDLRDADSLWRACRGADTVITTASSMPFSWAPPDNTIDTVDRAGQMRLIDAARAAGVGELVLVTFSGNIANDFPLASAKRAVEAHLRQSGMHYTILRPSYFMEVWLSPALGFDYAAGHATIYGGGGHKVSYISYADVAAFASMSVGVYGVRDATVELGGPNAVSQLQAAATFGAIAGRPLALTYVPLDALAAQQEAAPDDLQRSFAGLMRAYAMGDIIPMEATLELLPLRLTTVQEYAERSLAPAAV